MRRPCFVFVAWLGLQVPAAAWAQQAYTLLDSFKAAEKRSLTLAYQQEFINQAEENYSQGIGNILPNLNAYASIATQDNSSLSSLGTAFYPAEQHSFYITARQPLFRGMREYAALTQLGDLITAQKESKQWAGLQLLMDTAQSFYNVLANETDLSLIDSELTVYEQRIRDLQARVRIGRSRRTEVLTLQTSEAALKATREQVQGQLKVAREVYAFLTGLPPQTLLQDTEPMPALNEPLENWLARMNDRPDIQAGRQQVAAARTNVVISEEAHLPSLDVLADYYFYRNGILQGVSWDAQVTLTLPVFMGGILFSKTRQAASALRQSEMNVNSLENIARENIRSTYNNLQADLAQVTALEQAVQTSEANYRANLRDYNLALVTILEVLVAITQDQDNRRALERARFAAKNDYLHLQGQTAQLLPVLDKGEHP